MFRPGLFTASVDRFVGAGRRKRAKDTTENETTPVCLSVCVREDMAATTALLRKPVFTKVDQLRPGTSGHTLTVKVVSAKLVLQKARPDGNQVRHVRIAECIVGDDTGVIVFTARNEQGESEFFTPLKPRSLFFFVLFFCSFLWIGCPAAYHQSTKSTFTSSIAVEAAPSNPRYSLYFYIFYIIQDQFLKIFW